MLFSVTIDTEEDNWGDYARSEYTVENVRRIPRLQEAFKSRGVRPTYLISYPVATSPMAVEILGRCWADGDCEVGTHPHAWNTPPCDEEKTVFNSYLHHLPLVLQHRKIKCLHDTIERNFGAAPSSYRSGRWGFGDGQAAILARLGYTVDSSVTAGLDWSEDGGPDYTEAPIEPFVYRTENPISDSTSALLEVQPTVDFLQSPRRLASVVHRSIRSRVPLGRRFLGLFKRMGILNLVCLCPELFDARQMVRLIQVLLERDTKVLNMFFHSPSLLEGCSPFGETAGDVSELLGRIDRVLDFAQTEGVRFVTLSELEPGSVGASTVKIIPDVEASATQS